MCGRRTLGIDIGGTSVKLGFLDSEKGLTEIEQFNVVTGDPEWMVEQLVAATRRKGAELVGIGTAGQVNHKTGLVTAANLNWKDVPLRAMLEDRLGQVVWVDNDAQAALTAEWYSGECRGAQTAAYLTLGTGIGGALLVNGSPWRGNDNTSFELGHIVTHADGELCACSKRGCFERYASAGALSRMAGGRAAREIIDAVLAGDRETLMVFDAYLHELAIGLNTIITLFKPEVIALGGGVSVIGNTLLDRLRHEVNRQLADRAVLFTGSIVLSKHQNYAGMIGAAVLAKLHIRNLVGKSKDVSSTFVCLDSDEFNNNIRC